MNNTGSSSGLVLSFDLPLLAPTELDEVYARFKNLATECEATKGAIRDLEAKRDTLVADNVKARVAALAAGEDPPPDTAKDESKIETAIDDTKRRLVDLRGAVDICGNELADLVAEYRDGWLETLRGRDQQAVEIFSSAIAQAQEAAGEIGGLRSSIAWLERFDHGLAHIGQVRGWPGHRALTVRKDRNDRAFSYNTDDVNVVDVLRFVTKAATPPPEAQDREKVLTRV